MADEPNKPAAPAAEPKKRNWFDIVSDAMIPGKFQKGLIDRTRRQVDEAVKK